MSATGVSAAPAAASAQSTAVTAASVRSRRVHESRLVLPRSPSPTGPSTPAAPVTATSGPRAIEATTQLSARAASVSEAADDVHQRTAKRETVPGR